MEYDTRPKIGVSPGKGGAYGYSMIPRDTLLAAEKVLIGAMLREPFNLAQYLGRLNPVKLSNAGDGLAPAFESIISQFQQYGQYSPLSIQQKTGIDVSYHASNDSEIDLTWAIDNWKFEYDRWAETVALSQAVGSAWEDGVDAMRSAVDKQRERLGLTQGETNKSSVEDFLNWGIDKLEGNETYYKTTPHLDSVKEYIRYFEPGTLTLIAARPSMGKSLEALNLHSHFYNKGLKGVMFVLEVQKKANLKRLLGIRHGINHLANWKGEEKIIGPALTETASLDSTCPIVDDLYNIFDIEAWCMSAHYKGELDFVIIDYIGLMLQGKESPNLELSRISRALKLLAKRLNIPVIALSQLSRDVEKRGGSKRPQMADLRDSGSLEQDADIIIFLYRAEYYKILEDDKGESTVGLAEMIISKNREGPVGTAIAKYSPILGFTDLIDETRFPTEEKIMVGGKEFWTETTNINYGNHRDFTESKREEVPAFNPAAVSRPNRANADETPF